MKTMPKKQQAILNASLAVFVYVGLFVLMGFLKGIGTARAAEDGGVDFERFPIIKLMLLDYRYEAGGWSFGYFIPIIIIALLWVQRKSLFEFEAKPSYCLGGILILFSLFIYWIGFRGEQKYFGYISGQLLAAGMILWHLGKKYFGRLFWYWVLFGMMWPWLFLVELISSPLQRIMALFTASFLRVFNIGAVQNGSSVSTDTRDPITGNFINLDIDVACSGMRSLFALILVGIIFVILRLNKEWKKWFLMILVPFIAVFANFVRMLMLYFGAKIWGTEFAIGTDTNEMSGFHLFAGLIVFVVAIALMLLIAEALDSGKSLKKLIKKKKVRKINI